MDWGAVGHDALVGALIGALVAAVLMAVMVPRARRAIREDAAERGWSIERLRLDFWHFGVRQRYLAVLTVDGRTEDRAVRTTLFGTQPTWE